MAKPVDTTKPTCQLHVKALPMKLRVELDVLAAKKQMRLDELVPMVLRAGMRALKSKEGEEK